MFWSSAVHRQKQPPLSSQRSNFANVIIILNEVSVLQWINFRKEKALSMLAATTSFGGSAAPSKDSASGVLLYASAQGISDADREKYLLEWTTARCGEEGAAFTFEEGWSMIKSFGLDVLSDMMTRFLLNEDGKERKERLVGIVLVCANSLRFR